MIDFVSGNIFDSSAEAIVNTVNCVGVMGRGLALQFKKQYPENFKAYESACKCEKVVPGKMFVFETNQLTNPKYIINFPTKRHWRGASRIEDIELGLIDLVKIIIDYNIKSIAIPPLGAGLGGLDWNTVKIKIESAFENLTDVHVNVYIPNNKVAAEQTAKNKAVPKMTPGRAALVTLTQKYLEGLLDPFISLLEIHKLMYFLQECGEPLKLKFKKAYYGPYAENLSHVLKEIEGNLLSGYIDGGDDPSKQMTVIPGAKTDAAAFLEGNADTLNRIERVIKLIDGFETSFGMELLATVHWAANDGANTFDEIIDYTYKWGSQKHKFSERQIHLAAEHLLKNGWISVL